MFHDVILSHKPIRQMLLLRVSVTFSLLSLGSMTSLSDQRNISPYNNFGILNYQIMHCYSHCCSRVKIPDPAPLYTYSALWSKDPSPCNKNNNTLLVIGIKDTKLLHSRAGL